MNVVLHIQTHLESHQYYFLDLFQITLSTYFSDQTSSFNVIKKINEPGPRYVKLAKVCGKWNEKDETNTLEDISFDAQSRKLTAIVGPVGSGKGSVFNAILGEMPTNQGKICINGNLSYASQEAWVFSGNLRQNILFGEPFDANRYDEVLRVCDLNKDIKRFDHGDLTLGKFGRNLLLMFIFQKLCLHF